MAIEGANFVSGESRWVRCGLCLTMQNCKMTNCCPTASVDSCDLDRAICKDCLAHHSKVEPKKDVFGNVLRIGLYKPRVWTDDEKLWTKANGGWIEVMAPYMLKCPFCNKRGLRLRTTTNMGSVSSKRFLLVSYQSSLQNMWVEIRSYLCF